MSAQRSTEQRVSDDRLNEVAELAEIVADEHCPNGQIEPTKIANAKRITFCYGHYEDAFDGMLEYEGGRFHIYCNLDRVAAPMSGRARFTLGHELGHFYIDEHRIALERGLSPGHGSLCDFQSKNPVEVEADHFASALLMPSTRFRQRAARYVTGLDAILQLSDHFGTSVTSTALRYVKLDCGSCFVIKWNPDGYAWRWSAPSVFKGPYRGLRRGLETVLPDSPTGRCLAGEMQTRGEFLSAGSTASVWFPGAFAGSSRDVILVEQAIRLGEFGVLTVLVPEGGSI